MSRNDFHNRRVGGLHYCGHNIHYVAEGMAHGTLSLETGIGDESRHPRSTFRHPARSEEHTSELQSLMRISYAVFCLKKKKKTITTTLKQLIYTNLKLVPPMTK